MENISTKFGKGLKQLRTDKGYTLRELRNITGVPHNSIFAIENGTGKTDLKDLEHLAQGFKMSIPKLLKACGV